MSLPETPPIEALSTVDSTNAEAARRAAAGVRGPVWFVADTQQGGKGRDGRAWESPQGNLYATLLMPFTGPPADAALMSFVACLATADLLDALTGDPSRTTLKWPNDALLENRKVAGVLLEGGQGWLAAGIGVNLAYAPKDARWPAISIAEATGRTLPPREGLDVLVDSFERRTSEFREHGFAPIREAWLGRAAHLGKPIEARLPKETLTGVFEDIGPDGTLILATDTGRTRIAAADIHFPA